MQTDVIHHRNSSRFVVELDDGDEAYLDYREREDGVLDYVHTFVPESHRGGGIAGQIVLEALEHARRQGRRIKPSCPFVRHVIEDEHPEYRTLVAYDPASDPDADHS